MWTGAPAGNDAALARVMLVWVGVASCYQRPRLKNSHSTAAITMIQSTG